MGVRELRQRRVPVRRAERRRPVDERGFRLVHVLERPRFQLGGGLGQGMALAQEQGERLGAAGVGVGRARQEIVLQVRSNASKALNARSRGAAKAGIVLPDARRR